MVLPTPFGPTIPRRVRGPKDRLILSRISLVPRRKVTALADSTAGDPIAGRAAAAGERGGAGPAAGRGGSRSWQGSTGRASESRGPVQAVGPASSRRPRPAGRVVRGEAHLDHVASLEFTHGAARQRLDHFQIEWLVAAGLHPQPEPHHGSDLQKAAERPHRQDLGFGPGRPSARMVEVRTGARFAFPTARRRKQITAPATQEGQYHEQEDQVPGTGSKLRAVASTGAAIAKEMPWERRPPMPARRERCPLPPNSAQSRPSHPDSRVPVAAGQRGNGQSVSRLPVSRPAGARNRSTASLNSLTSARR